MIRLSLNFNDLIKVGGTASNHLTLISVILKAAIAFLFLLQFGSSDAQGIQVCQSADDTTAILNGVQN